MEPFGLHPDVLMAQLCPPHHVPDVSFQTMECCRAPAACGNECCLQAMPLAALFSEVGDMAGGQQEPEEEGEQLLPGTSGGGPLGCASPVLQPLCLLPQPSRSQVGNWGGGVQGWVGWWVECLCGHPRPSNMTF